MIKGITKHDVITWTVLALIDGDCGLQPAGRAEDGASYQTAAEERRPLAAEHELTREEL